MNTTKSKIETTVTIRLIHDDCIGIEQAKERLFSGDLDYLQEEEKRFQAWKQDEFYFLGVRVLVEIHNWHTGNNRKFESAGLWGIESDSDSSYFLEVARDELHNLQAEFPELKDLVIDEKTPMKYS